VTLVVTEDTDDAIPEVDGGGVGVAVVDTADIVVESVFEGCGPGCGPAGVGIWGGGPGCEGGTPDMSVDFGSVGLTSD